MTIVVVNNVNSSTDVISERISKRIEKDQFLNTSFQHGFSSPKKTLFIVVPATYQ